MRLRYTGGDGRDRSRLLNALVAAHRVLPGFAQERLSWELSGALARRMRVQTTKWSPGILLHGAGTLELGPSFNIRRSVEFRIGDGEIVRLGDGIGIDSYTILEPHTSDTAPGFIEIGANSFISSFCHFSGDGGITIGPNVGIGAFTRIAASTHHYGTDGSILAQPKTCRGITIGEGVWLASHVAVLDGVTIGDHAVIGAGSVVRTSIPPRSVAVGAPARVVKTF
jgi:acetyltransferase-like isoleucine patch superfamily enzyme